MDSRREREDYRRKLIDAFPPAAFHGLVSSHDECDDGIFLRRELAGKRWDELSADVLLHGSNSLSLLEPGALVAFLPAWLARSVEVIEQPDPLVLEFTLYFLCPGDEDEGWDTDEIAATAQLFNSAQRDAVVELFTLVVNRSPRSGCWTERAESAIRWWKSP